MITIKSPREIETMRRSGKITAKVLGDLMRRRKPGMTTARARRAWPKSGIRAMGGVPTFKGYHGYPCIDLRLGQRRGRARHPGRRACCSDGDLLSIDIGTTLRRLRQRHGRHGRDRQRSARTPQRLMRRHARVPDARHRADAARASASATSAPPSSSTPRAHGYGVVRELVGHGVGTQDARGAAGPQLRQGRARASELRPGLVLAIEPMITEGDYEVETLKDGWTVVTADGKLAAHFEHTIADDRRRSEDPDAARHRRAPRRREVPPEGRDGRLRPVDNQRTESSTSESCDTESKHRPARSRGQ